MQTLLGCVAVAAMAQPSYYESRARQTAEYRSLSEATSRAYSASGSSYTPPANRSNTTNSSSTSSTGSGGARPSAPAISNSGNNGYSDIGAYDRVRRQEAAGARNEARRIEQHGIISRDEATYRKLIAGKGVATTEADYYDLVLTAMRNSIDLRAAYNVIGHNLQEYVAKWGVHPDRPFQSSDGSAQRAAHALEAINDPENKSNLGYFYEQIARVYDTEENWVRAGHAYLVEANYRKAQDAFNHLRVMEGADKNKANAGLAATFAFADNLESAAYFFGAVLKTAPNQNSDFLNTYAWVKLRQSKPQEAKELMEQASGADPIHPGFWLIQAALEKDPARAQGFADEATRLQPMLGKGNTASRLLAMAKFLNKQEAYQEAAIYLDYGLMLEPKNIDLLELRYGTSMKINRDAQAKADEKTISEL